MSKTDSINIQLVAKIRKNDKFPININNQGKLGDSMLKEI